MDIRDLCWLVKPVIDSAIKTYQIDTDSVSPMIDTLKRELEELFPMITETSENASIHMQEVNDSELGEEGYRIEKVDCRYRISAQRPCGLLYGLLGLHRILVTGRTDSFPVTSIPSQAIRMINHWDNFDGSVERGYAGGSIFFDGKFREDYGLVRQYARLLASVGINAVSINNVNVKGKAVFLINKRMLADVKRIADIFTAYGIKLFLSVNFAAAMKVGGLHTADPLDASVQKFWTHIVEVIYSVIPEFGGFLVKADSEGESGPFTYNRTHADGANMLACALEPFHGILIWRCFVYNCNQNWWDRETDRAKAAYDIFCELDGKFKDNVILQIKNGPIDFQIREPVSPLLGALRRTNQILEFQITQEYTGQQVDLCYLVPMFKEVLDFKTGYEKDLSVKEILPAFSPSKKLSGIAAVSNVGMDDNWTGSKLAQLNLYGYGRLCWDNDLSSEEIATDWIRQTFYLSKESEKQLRNIVLTSRDTYEDYTVPLSVGFMCRPGIHYGVDIDGYEYDRWGTYHYADRDGIGRDRTITSGTGFTRQYSDKWYKIYENVNTCPDELLLFFHHVPYTYRLQSGETVIQHIYNTHFRGVEKVKEYIAVWDELKDELDEETYQNGKERFKRQLENAMNWKEAINTYFYRKSGISDEAGRMIHC